MRDGFSFQAGVALAFVDYLARMMKEAAVKASFVLGGSKKYLVDMLKLKECLTGGILDGQTFDFGAVRSIASDAPPVMPTPFTSYNFQGKGNCASIVDACMLGATEADVNFNANVVTLRWTPASRYRQLAELSLRRLYHSGCSLILRPDSGDRRPSHHSHGPRRADCSLPCGSCWKTTPTPLSRLARVAALSAHFCGDSADLSFTSSGTNLGWMPSNCLVVGRVGPHVVSRSSFGFEPLEKI